VTALEKYSERALRRRRRSPPKIVVLSNALRSAVDPQGPPGEDDPVRFGAWVENACLAHAWNRGQSVSYWREEPLEVDGVIDGSWGAWAIEVKTGPFDVSDLRGLLEFTRRHPRFRPLVPTGRGGAVGARRAGVASQPWTSFLLSGPPRA
jgi:predicted AAA+ superfamily ATPase